MATLPPSPFCSAGAEPLAETLVVVPSPQAPVAAAGCPFDFTGVSAASPVEEAAASITSPAPDAAAEFVDLDATDCIGQIFVGARKLNLPRFKLDVEQFMLDIEEAPLFLRATG